jgi:hypothetical protein
MVLVAGGAAGASLPQAPAAAGFHDAGDAECDVYAAYLDKNFKPSPNDGPLARSTLIVENEALDAWQSNRRAWESFLLGRISGPGRASDACIRAFLQRPQQILRFFKFPPTRHALKLVRSDQLNAALSPDWQHFYAAYPGSNGILSFGVIAWGPDRNEALFTVRSRCGAHCGYRDIAYMQRISGSWELILKESLP